MAAHMKPNELRIGNLIQHGNTAYRIISFMGTSYVEVDSAYVNFATDDQRELLISECTPIELTEELAMKLGLNKKSPITWTFPKLNVPFIIYLSEPQFSNSPFELFYTGNQPDGSASGCDVGIDFVHQLQNLYFALTGEELILK